MNKFMKDNSPQTLLVTRVADSGLDVPELTCCLQIDRFGCSRQQEVQRVGRVQRLKLNGDPSYFFNIATDLPGSKELECNTWRMDYLRSLGYEVITYEPEEILTMFDEFSEDKLYKFGRNLWKIMNSKTKTFQNKYLLDKYVKVLNSLPIKEF